MTRSRTTRGQSSADPELAPDRRVRTQEPVPHVARPVAGGALDRRRRPHHLGGDRPSTAARSNTSQLRLALLRGPRAADAYNPVNDLNPEGSRSRRRPCQALYALGDDSVEPRNRGTSERVLIEDWCIQFNTHTVGSLVFGPDGALYAAAGDGADWRRTDYGQFGDPVNPCDDPPAGIGRAAPPDVAEGGSLRALSPLREAGSPITLDGTVIRIDPETGAALPDNPWAASDDPNLRRIIAFGLKNPFRVTLDTQQSALWIGDVGHSTWEEINRLPLPVRTPVNFGWPCYEGAPRQDNYNRVNELNPDGFQIATTGRCRALYDDGDDAVEPPFFAYRHYQSVTPADGCPFDGSAISGLAFYGGDRYPAEYRGALFFSDFGRGCIWMLPEGDDGLPDPTAKKRFRWNARTPVELTSGPDGDLFYLDYVGGELHRIVYREPA